MSLRNLLPWLVTGAVGLGLALSRNTAPVVDDKKDKPIVPDARTRAANIIAAADANQYDAIDPDEALNLSQLLAKTDPETSARLVVIAGLARARRLAPQAQVPLLDRAAVILDLAAAGNYAAIDWKEAHALAQEVRKLDPATASRLVRAASQARSRAAPPPPVDTRPTPGVLPADLAARLAALEAPGTKATGKDAYLLLIDLDKYQGFDAVKRRVQQLITTLPGS